MQYSIDLHEYFIKIECVAKSVSLLLQTFGVFRAELVTPETNGFIADFNFLLAAVT